MAPVTRSSTIKKRKRDSNADIIIVTQGLPIQNNDQIYNDDNIKTIPFDTLLNKPELFSLFAKNTDNQTHINFLHYLCNNDVTDITLTKYCDTFKDSPEKADILNSSVNSKTPLELLAEHNNEKGFICLIKQRLTDISKIPAGGISPFMAAYKKLKHVLSGVVTQRAIIEVTGSLPETMKQIYDSYNSLPFNTYFHFVVHKLYLTFKNINDKNIKDSKKDLVIRYHHNLVKVFTQTLVLAIQEKHYYAIYLLLFQTTYSQFILPSSNNVSPIFHACMTGDTIIIKMMLDAGTNFAKIVNGINPLSTFTKDNIEAFTLIVDTCYKKQINKINVNENGNDNILREMVTNIFKTDDNNNNILHRNVTNNMPNILKYLLNFPLTNQINQQTNRGCTPLMCAISKGNKEAIQILLLNKQIDITIRDNLGHTAMSYAYYYYEESVPLLLAHIDIKIKELGKVNNNNNNNNNKLIKKYIIEKKGHLVYNNVCYHNLSEKPLEICMTIPTIATDLTETQSLNPQIDALTKEINGITWQLQEYKIKSALQYVNNAKLPVIMAKANNSVAKGYGVLKQFVSSCAKIYSDTNNNILVSLIKGKTIDHSSNNSNNNNNKPTIKTHPPGYNYQQEKGYTKPTNLSYNHLYLPYRLYDIVTEQNLEHMAAFGKFIALSLLYCKNDMPLSPIFFKYILNDIESITLSDVLTINVANEYYKLFDASPETILDLDLTFSVRETVLNPLNNMYVTENIDLINDGSNITVTKDNLQLYIDKLTIFHVFAGGRKSLLDAFRQGYNELLDIMIYKELVTSTDLTIMTIHKKKIPEIKSWKDNTKITYKNMNLDNTNMKPEQLNTLDLYWHYVSTLTSNSKHKLIEFITASPIFSVMDHGFVKSVNNYFTIEFTDNKDILPSASTCNNTLVLPIYTSYEILEKNFNLALDNMNGEFQFV